MKEILVNQIMPEVLYIIITAILGLLTYYVKQFLIAKKDFLEHQRQELIQKIGIDKYNQDVAIAKRIVMSVEEQARQHDWGSTIKHATATKLIAEKTGLSADDIFNMIKATVAELNKDKSKATVKDNIVAPVE